MTSAGNGVTVNPGIKLDFRWGWRVLGVLLLLYAVLFAAYYPPLPGIEDEVGFINQAIVFSHGSISAEGAGSQYAHLDDFVWSKGRTVSWRNPGRSLLVAALLPFGGYRSVFISGAVIHIAAVLVAALILARMGRSPLWAVLVLCHPTLALYSRAVMGDEGSGLFLLLALYAVVALQRPGLWAGLCIGLAAVMRYQSGLVLPFVCLAIAFTLPIRHARREGLLCFAAGSVVGAGIAAYNVYLFGHAIGWTAQGYFAAKFIPDHLLFYAVALLTLWPLMLLTVIFDRSAQRFVVLALTVPLVLLLIPYYFLDKGTSALQSLVLGQRLIQPVLPVWIACYAWTVGQRLVPRLDKFAAPRIWRAAGAVLCVGLIASTAGIFSMHQKRLEALATARQAVIDHVPDHAVLLCNSTVRKLFGVPDSGPQYTKISFNAYQAMLQPDNDLHLEGTHFYLAVLPKDSSEDFGDSIIKLVQHYHMLPVKTKDPALMLFESPGLEQ